ncbi:TlpA family protein disulfide reductase [Sinomicrobium weinanense]|uniref:Thioredoxin domain-containing protein n=1 Tax=Sinomicrobium weinanense TaxID=2842200 RepID=A0A926JUP7_9FLAO|nr:thioredoxin-like domain-containing protein [Sinomicrobium weinanense]MBC9797654.1 hypothetical protein [Sinomicrobium weinanense]MBU3122664.1 hypothetical protein [Sinomicrobium weinanense]
MRNLLIAFLVLPFIGCNNSKNTIAYFGGEVINPRDSIVVLFRDDKPIDTALLDSENRFVFKVKLKDNEGDLYKFRHFPEYQYVFIQGGDSILARVNTLNFDESLVFSGRGAEKNNFLIEMYLLDGDEQKLVYSYYSLKPDEFDRKIDSLRDMKLQQYEHLIVTQRLSEPAKNVARASINYPSYKSKEFYPYMHKRLKGIDRKNLLDMPEGFFAYRNTINYNDKNLSFYKPYFDFMVYHFNSMAYVKCVKECARDDDFIEKSVHYYLHKMDLIDDKVKEKGLKDYLFRNTAYTYYLDDQDEANNTQFIEKFRELNSDNEYIDEIETLYTNVQKLRKGSHIPPMKLIDMNGEYTDLAKICHNRNTVVYFWTLFQNGHSKYINRHVMNLKQQYPTVNFVGICLNEDYDEWLEAISLNGLRDNDQYLSQKRENISKGLTVNNLNKVIVVDKENQIVNAFTYIHSPEFTAILNSLR